MLSQCPNQFPTRDLPGYRIALIGEAPGADELKYFKPFCGYSGLLLNDQLSARGMPRNTVFIGNVSQCRPDKNEFDNFDWDGPEVQDGIGQLLADLNQYRPNLVVTMGNASLHLFMAGNVAPNRVKRGSGWKHAWEFSVTRWRGSLFLSSLLLTPQLHRTKNDAEAALDTLRADHQWKCLCTIHPAYVLRQPGEGFNLSHDLKRAREEGTDPVLTLPETNFAYGPA